MNPHEIPVGDEQLAGVVPITDQLERWYLELDCPPGSPRPGDLLPSVLVGTGLEKDSEATTSRLFGNWRWDFETPVGKHDAVKGLLKIRITELYHAGLIRYGSW